MEKRSRDYSLADLLILKTSVNNDPAFWGYKHNEIEYEVLNEFGGPDPNSEILYIDTSLKVWTPGREAIIAEVKTRSVFAVVGLPEFIKMLDSTEPIDIAPIKNCMNIALSVTRGILLAKTEGVMTVLSETGATAGFLFPLTDLEQINTAPIVSRKDKNGVRIIKGGLRNKKK